MSKPLLLISILIVIIVVAYINAYIARKNGYYFAKTFIFTIIGLIGLAYFILQLINF